MKAFIVPEHLAISLVRFLEVQPYNNVYTLIDGIQNAQIVEVTEATPAKPEVTPEEEIVAEETSAEVPAEPEAPAEEPSEEVAQPE